MSDLIPNEETDVDAAQWVASRLTIAQRKALLGLDALRKGAWAYAADMGATGSTMRALNDFARSQRGILPPFILVRNDYTPEERCYHWQITSFGRRVAAIAKATS